MPRHLFFSTGPEVEVGDAYTAFYDRDPGAVIDDDVLAHLAWSLTDVGSWSAVPQRTSRGLDWSGVTILGTDAARALREIARAWIALLRVGPRWVVLGPQSGRGGDGEDHLVWLRCAPRDRTIASLEELVAALDRVCASGDGRLLHLGI